MGLTGVTPAHRKLAGEAHGRIKALRCPFPPCSPPAPVAAGHRHRGMPLTCRLRAPPRHAGDTARHGRSDQPSALTVLPVEVTGGGIPCAKLEIRTAGPCPVTTPSRWRPTESGFTLHGCPRFPRRGRYLPDRIQAGRWLIVGRLGSPLMPSMVGSLLTPTARRLAVDPAGKAPWQDTLECGL